MSRLLGLSCFRWTRWLPWVRRLSATKTSDEHELSCGRFQQGTTLHHITLHYNYTLHSDSSNGSERPDLDRNVEAQWNPIGWSFEWTRTRGTQLAPQALFEKNGMGLRMGGLGLICFQVMIVLDKLWEQSLDFSRHLCRSRVFTREVHSWTKHPDLSHCEWGRDALYQSMPQELGDRTWSPSRPVHRHDI